MRKFSLTLLAIVAIGVAAGACSKHLPTEVSRSAFALRGDVITTEGCDLEIGDLVWNDLNANGCQDAGEPGISGITVKLLDGKKDVLQTKVTDSKGHYKFDKLCPGDYEVMVVLPNGCFLTSGGKCGDDKDSDPNYVFLKLDSKTNRIDFGVFCKPSDEKEDCGPCEGKVTELGLRYNGAEPAFVSIEQKKAKNVEQFSAQVNPGQTFTVVGVDKKGTLGTEIKVFVNGTLHTKIHTSCSQPIGPGLRFGDFEVVGGRSLKGGPLCPLDPPDVSGGDFCETYGRPKGLVMTYTGDDCSATHHSQDAGKVVCSTTGALPSTAHLVVTDSATEGAGHKWFDGMVPVGGEFTLDAANDGATSLATNTWVYVYNGQVLVQKVQFHTSCSQPLLMGDQFGSVRLEGFIPRP